MARLICLTLLIGLALSPGSLGAAVQITSVRPSTTDAGINQADQPHRLFLDPEVAARGELLVFLPGTGATTTDQDRFGQLAAEMGYHVAYVMYPNNMPAAVCTDDADETTFEKFRRELISGDNLDPRVNVDRANCIENRLLKLVRWLAANRAAEGWGQFLDGDGELRWRKLALAGHSQGGANAQLMAKDHVVARLVELGSPKDFNHRHQRPAVWYGIGATPPSRCFALVHEQDTQACTYAQQLENLGASGFAGVANIDGSEPPYHGAHVLTTNAPGKPISSGLAHLGLVFDFALPRSGGKNALAAAWHWMLTAPVE